MKILSGMLASGLVAATGAAMASHPRLNDLHLPDDVNRDFSADIFFRLDDALAYSTSLSPSTGVYAGHGGAGYEVVAVSDFDGDRSADVLWTDGSHLKLWVNNDSGRYSSVSIGSYSGGWVPFAAGDINGDGRSDILFRGSTHLAYWLMDGARVTRSSYAGDGGAGYRVVAVADFTGSGSADVLWTNGSQLKLWAGNASSSTFEPHLIGTYGGGWEPFAGGDLTGDGLAEILFRGDSHLAYWQLKIDRGFEYSSHYFGDGGAGYRVVGVSKYAFKDDPAIDILWSNGSHLKLWQVCSAGGGWCDEPWVDPIDLGNYGGGWQPLVLLIPQG